MKTVCMYQPSRLGDILYTVPIAQRLTERGYNVKFIIKNTYNNIIKHFPNINFVECDFSNPLSLIPQEPCIFLPLWYSSGFSMFNDDKINKRDIMVDKYRSYNLIMNDNINPQEYWRRLNFKRFPENEQKLFKVLGLKEGEKYILINEHCSKEYRKIEVSTNLKKIYMDKIGDLKEFSLLDWSGIIENAEEIHTVHTSLIYIIEVLKTTKNLHLYERPTGKIQITHILGKKYIEHK